MGCIFSLLILVVCHVLDLTFPLSNSHDQIRLAPEPAIKAGELHISKYFHLLDLESRKDKKVKVSGCKRFPKHSLATKNNKPHGEFLTYSSDSG